MAEIVNLRQARKRKARAEKDATAAQNRLMFGRTKAERTLSDAKTALETKRVEQHKRENGPGDKSGQ
ncbi:DUF4169 family protein [Pelagibacterium xiamenense]|uniref:DUF4169 family protein n=1 Tax=Pelagibacterium xiamenense TaxID=2901140 RepID=UPI001E59552F|nr:DUF4169 family protein [Pelagibacterium xiamenense]MCD7060946.1 DUF4169 family protein [Pelagibacterium xiamenense]